jgi:hypothetical protein
MTSALASMILFYELHFERLEIPKLVPTQKASLIYFSRSQRKTE